MEWTPPGCVKELSPSLSYPACCPRVVCPQDSEASDQDDSEDSGGVDGSSFSDDDGDNDRDASAAGDDEKTPTQQ